MVTAAVSGKGLKPVSGRRHQIIQVARDDKQVEFTFRASEEVGGKSLWATLIEEDFFAELALRRYDHFSKIVS